MRQLSSKLLAEMEAPKQVRPVGHLRSHSHARAFSGDHNPRSPANHSEPGLPTACTSHHTAHHLTSLLTASLTTTIIYAAVSFQSATYATALCRTARTRVASPVMPAVQLVSVYFCCVGRACPHPPLPLMSALPRDHVVFTLSPLSPCPRSSG